MFLPSSFVAESTSSNGNAFAINLERSFSCTLPFNIPLDIYLSTLSENTSIENSMHSSFDLMLFGPMSFKSMVTFARMASGLISLARLHASLLDDEDGVVGSGIDTIIHGGILHCTITKNSIGR